MSAPMPTWMKQMLIDKGVLTEQGLSRKARILTHRPCGIPTLAGIDSDRCGLDAWCDLAEIHAYGEAMALLSGRRTYELWGGRLGHRDHWMIQGRPAGGTRYPVFAEHRCHEPIPTDWIHPSKPAPQPTARNLEEIPW